MESISVVTITDKELDDHLEAATGKVSSFPFRSPRPEPEAAGTPATLGGRRFSYRPLQNKDGPVGAASTTTFSVVETIQAINPRDDLFSDTEHHVLREIRRSVQLFYQIYEYYEQASGLERLKTANKAGQLGRDQEGELKAKTETASAVSLFALAAYLSRKLVGHRQEEVERIVFEVESPDRLLVDNQANALHSALFYLVESIKRHAKDDPSLTRAVLEASRQLTGRISTTARSLAYLEFYTRYHYRIEPDGVTITGFEMEEPASALQVEVQEKRPEEVVGNHIAKFEAMRLAQRLVCYDRARQHNPFVDLGGFSFTLIGDGSPGTGKTTLIQMTVTLLKDYCKTLSLPFRYLNFSVDEISDYQGRSGQNAKRFCRTVLDPRGIGFGTIDDVDQVCANRNDKNSSAGQLEVTAVFMQEFAGPNTVVRGNASFGLFSNYPEKVDDALRQRTQARFLVDGPRTLEDFTDLLHLLLSPNWEMPLGAGYQPFTTQQVRRVIQTKYEQHARPQAPALVKIFDEHARGGKISTWIEFGHYLHALQKHDERFTGRAVKNISDAIRFRMMDFDLPQEWFEKPEKFFTKPYETRMEMLKELRGTITPEIVLQEINRYADSEERYAAVARERELTERTRQIVLDAKARIAAAREPL
ncbi:MAG: AAA family ATPase [Candidatus Riflebacteria bacterium]|nr:AAA family ATPase [Candidatus Riflebacteria bacterium]